MLVSAADARTGDGRGLPRVPEAFFPAAEARARLDGLPPLVVVQAPRGYGKTTTVSSWLRRRDLPDHDLVWLSLPPTVTDREGFWEALHEAIVQTGYEDPRGGADGWERLARTARARRRHLVVVVDAYDRQPDHDVDAELVELAQGHEHLHLVLLMRSPRPAVALGGAAPDGVVLRAEDLALDSGQVVHMGRALGRPVDAVHAEDLCQGLGGWPGLLRVALLTATPGPGGVPVPDLSSIGAYLRVVLGDIDAERHTSILTALAVPRTVTRELIDEIIGGEHVAAAERILARMARAGLLRPVDGAAGEFAYPDLLREAGRLILLEDDPARYWRLNAAAAERCAAAGDGEGAVSHALDAQDHDLLRRMVETFWDRLIDDHRDLVRRAVAHLPEAADGTVLTALRDHVLPAAVPRWFPEAVQSDLTLIEPGDRTVALASADPEVPGLPAALVALGRAELRGSAMTRAAFAFYEAVRRATGEPEPGVLREAGAGLALTLAVLGHPLTAGRWLQWTDHHPGGPGGSLERVARIAVPATAHLDALQDVDLPTEPPDLPEEDRWLETLLLQLWAMRSLHRGDAGDHLADLERYWEQRSGWGGARLAESLLGAAMVDLCVATDQLARARELLQGFGTPRPGQTWATIARARVALYAGDDRQAFDLSQGAAELSPVRCRSALTASLIHAVAAHRLGDRATASEALYLATRIAERTGMLRPFLLVPRGDVEAVAQSMPGGRAVLDRSAAIDGPFPDPVRAEPLSGREIKVLRELATGRPVAVIARRLYVSESTVKTQVRSIYRKFGVHSRTDAVARGQVLGLLPAGS